MRRALPILAVCLLLLALLGAAQAVTYVPRELPGLAGDAYAKEINNSGQVAGLSYDPVDSRMHPVFWDTDGTMADLGWGQAWDLNNLGQVLCTTYDHGASIWSTDGSWLELSACSGNTSPFVMNDAGQVAGWMSAGDDNFPAFLWSADTGLMSIGALPGDIIGEPRGINNAGQIVGASYGTYMGDYRPFIWSTSTGVQPLSLLPGGIMGMANSINDKGQVAGYSWVNDDTDSPDYHGVLWNPDGSIVDLGKGVAYSINNKGQITCSVNWLMYVRDPDGTLNPLPPLPGMEQPYGECINDAGVVVGQCLDAQQLKWHAVIWEPLRTTTVGIAIDPCVLNPKAKGNWITCTITVPEGEKTAADIDAPSLRLQGICVPCGPAAHVDASGCLVVKFGRAAVCGALGTGTQTMKLTGTFKDGNDLAGECTVRVLGK